MDFAEIRRVAITAIFSDDLLLEHLVLKGGSALNLVYDLEGRTSLDLDFSMHSDFPDLNDARRRLFRALRDRFDAARFVVFDEQLKPKPPLDVEDTTPWWGGYELRFKLIEREKYERLRASPDKLRINATVTGGRQLRTFTVDFSKCEYTKGNAEHELDHFTIHVYTPEMIVIEKLRAICQQMPDYPYGGVRRPARARDFYDIHRVVTRLGVDLASEDNLELAKHIFAAKHVPLSLLPKIAEYREFHRPDWPSVQNSASDAVEGFDFYFNFVIEQTERLQSLWVE